MASDDRKIIYVTREIERALGMAPDDSYSIVSNKTPYGETIQKKYPAAVTLIADPGGALLGTTELLNHPDVAKLLTPSSKLMVFKNTVRVETAAKARNCELLNSPAALSERVENKLSQLRWLGAIGTRLLPPHAAKVAKYIVWRNDPFVIQWAHGHTGDGTILIRTADDLRAIQEKFPERMARLTSYIEGPSFTVNAVVTPTRVIVGNASYQITGLSPFTDNSFATVGNDWGAARQMLSPDETAAIRGMAEEIGKKLQADGWKGLFGIDLIRDASRNRLYLIEINARQPASATFESELQEEARSKGARGLTTFEAHVRALQGQPIDQDLIEITDGAQIVQRVTKQVQSLFDDAAARLEKAGYGVVAYQNTTPNADLLRIHSPASIMEGHGILNVQGRKIVEMIKSAGFNIQV